MFIKHEQCHIHSSEIKEKPLQSQYSISGPFRLYDILTFDNKFDRMHIAITMLQISFYTALVKIWSEFFTLGCGVLQSLLNIRQRRPF